MKSTNIFPCEFLKKWLQHSKLNLTCTSFVQDYFYDHRNNLDNAIKIMILTINCFSPDYNIVAPALSPKAMSILPGLDIFQL